MSNLSEILILLVSTVFDHANAILTSLSEAIFQPETESGLALAFALGAMAYGVIPEGVLTNIRKWHGGHHDRTEATDEVAEVKVRVINEDNIRVVTDRSAGENAGQVTHGWSPGVSNAVIVITAAALDRQHHEDFEAQVREVERQHQEIERLHAELNEKK